MAKVRCPMCGETNPADASICQYCQARLKPLFAEESIDQTPLEADGYSQNRADDLKMELPDWLLSLRKGQGVQSPPAPSSDTPSKPDSDPKESLPDWLGRLRDQSGEDSAPGPSTESLSNQGVEPNSSDWFEKLLSDEDSSLDEDANRPPSDEFKEEADWLNRISGDQSQPPAQPTPATPSWLSDLEESSPDVGPPVYPDWQDQEKERNSGPPGETPDWLAPKTPVEPPPEPKQPITEPEPQAPKKIKWPTFEEAAPAEEQSSSETNLPIAEQPEEITETVFPDWLAISKDEPAEPVNQSASDASTPTAELPVERIETDFPDWSSDSNEDVPEWLKQPASETTAPSIEQPVGKNGSEVPDWLANSQEELPDLLKQPVSGASAPSAQQVETELPDWLAAAAVGSLSENTGPEPPASKDETKDDAPDWISELSPDTRPRPQQPAGQAPSELPDWLSQLMPEPEETDLEQPVEQPGVAVPEEFSEPEPEMAESENEELPAWLAGASANGLAVAAITTDSEDDVSQWLSQPNLELASSDLSRSSVESEAEIPDWMVESPPLDFDLPLETTASATAELAPEQPALPEVPDWLSESEPETPDWMARAMSETPAPISEQAQEPPEQEIPGWMPGGVTGALVAKVALEGRDEEVPSENAPTEETPAWMPSTFAPVEAEQSDLAESTVFTDSSEAFGDDLSWLNELETAFPEMPSAQAVTGVEGDLAPPGEQPAGGLEQVLPGALPAWLAVATASHQETEAAISKDENDLTPGELPGWLQAMRPVALIGAAAVAEQAQKGEAEGAGPLAGLHGALPAEPDIYPTVKPATYSVKLLVTETQQANSELLEQLVKAESEARPVPARPAITSQHLFRLAIALVLIFPVLFTILTGFPEVGLPGLPPDTNAVRQLVDGLPAGAPVLVAIDYQPGFSGELDAATSALLNQLMGKGAYLTLVSSQTTGPLLAERLVGLVNTGGGRSYSSPGQYTNLGFVPGGSTGLLSFAQTPRDVLPADINGNQVWDNQSLHGVQSLADFALVLVATENPDTARSWIEQVQPFLVKTPASVPMVMVLSAQAEPLVRPYYDASPKQVQGLVVGLADSVAYQDMGLAKSYWSAYSMGILASVLLIFIGGVVTAIAVRVSKGKETASGEEKK